MFCRFCGEQMKDDSIYCLKCGKPLSPSSNAGEKSNSNGKSSPSKSRTTIICLALVAFILAGLVAALLMYQSQMQKENSIAINELTAKIEKQEKLIKQRDDAARKNQSKITALLKTQKNYDFIVSQLKRGNVGSAAGYFKVDRGIVVVKKSDTTQKIKLTTAFSNGATIEINYNHSADSGVWGAASLEFDDDSWYNNTTLTVHPYNVGVTAATFTSSSNDLSFRVLIIVTE